MALMKKLKLTKISLEEYTITNSRSSITNQKKNSERSLASTAYTVMQGVKATLTLLVGFHAGFLREGGPFKYT